MSNSGFKGSWPNYDLAEGEFFKEAIDRQRLAISGYTGEKNRSFEQRFSKSFREISGCEFNIPCSSGSSALALALEACGVGLNDEVIVPACTWIAPTCEVLRVNAKPVVVDIDIRTLCMNLSHVENVITSKTKALLSVNLYGNCPNPAELRQLCDRNDIKLIEDCAQSHGGVANGRKLGSFGDCSVFSFQQSKQITSGEGGAICTSDPIIAAHAHRFKNNSRVLDTKRACEFDVELFDLGPGVGTNAGLSEIQIAMVLDSQTRFKARKISVQTRMNEYSELARKFGVTVPQPDYIDDCHRYCLPLLFNDTSQKNNFLDALRTLGFGSFFAGSIYEPVYKSKKFEPKGQPRFRGLDLVSEDWYEQQCEVAERVHATGAFVHHSVFLNHENITLAGDALHSVFRS